MEETEFKQNVVIVIVAAGASGKIRLPHNQMWQNSNIFFNNYFFNALIVCATFDSSMDFLESEAVLISYFKSNFTTARYFLYLPYAKTT